MTEQRILSAKDVKVGFKDNAVDIDSSFFRGRIKDPTTYELTLVEASKLSPEHRELLTAGFQNRAAEKLPPIGYEGYVIDRVLRDLNNLPKV